MDTLSVTLELPRDLLRALDVSEIAAPRRVGQLVALELYREGRISAGKAAELSGASTWEFRSLLARHGIEPAEETPEELAHEVETVEGLLESASR